MRVLVLGGSTAGAQAGHQVTLCTPYYALGEDAAGSWAVHSKTGWEAWRQRLDWLAMDEKPCPLTLKRALDVCLRAQGVRVLYVSRPAAIVQCGCAAACALIEEDHGLGFYPADLVLDAGTYGEYTAALTQDGLRFPAHAVGYLAGRVAGMCVKQQCAAQALSLAPLQEEMRRAGAIVPVAPVPVQDTALRIACGDERGFAQAVLTNDAAVLTALPPFEQAGALSNRLLADKTRLWFGDISGAQRCTETLEQLCARLRGYAYIDRQGKDGVVRAGLVGPLDDYWLAIQLCVLLSKAHYAPAQPAILAFLRDTSIEDTWTNQESAYASIRLDCHTPPSYDRALSLAYACRLMPFADAAAELARLLRQTERGHACSRNPWQDYLSLCLRRALEACQKNG